MAKLVTKFKYLKPTDKLSPGGYAKYIATREGVEKIDESFKLKPVTVNQKQLIAKMLRDFPWSTMTICKTKRSVQLRNLSLAQWKKMLRR